MTLVATNDVMMQTLPKRGDNPCYTLTSTEVSQIASHYTNSSIYWLRKVKEVLQEEIQGLLKVLCQDTRNWRLEDMPAELELQEPTHSHTHCAQ